MLLLGARRENERMVVSVKEKISFLFLVSVCAILVLDLADSNSRALHLCKFRHNDGKRITKNKITLDGCPKKAKKEDRMHDGAES